MISTHLQVQINMIKHVTEKQKNAIILLIDFKKAFDSIDHVFMHNALSLLGFGPDIIAWINFFFRNRNAQILMGGHMSNEIHLNQGVPQGDVISPYIFILMVELLLLKINFTKQASYLQKLKQGVKPLLMILPSFLKELQKN